MANDPKESPSPSPSHSRAQSARICDRVPQLLSSFVDTFVDFSVSGGLFLPPQDPSHQPPPPLQTLHSAPDRVVAIGDLHGDLPKSKQALALAGLIDAEGRWTGGSSTVVQVGDVLDRGGDELKILYFLEKLKREAARSGGKVITMNGNHEIMNVDCDFRYVTEQGLEEFRAWADWFRTGIAMKGLCKALEKEKDPLDGIPVAFPGIKQEFLDGFRARIAALQPNGPISSRFLSQNLTVVVVGESVFVHGGILAEHASYGLQRVNDEVRDWINGLKGRLSPHYMRGRNSLVWLRKFSDENAKNCDCSALEHALATIPGAKRMIMGHTIQESGINGACNDRAIRIDVGLSKGCGNGLPEVLEITGNSELRILTSNPLYQNKHRSHLGDDRKSGLGLLLQEGGPRQVDVKS